MNECDHNPGLICGNCDPSKVDMINHPPHYDAGSVYETIRVIEAWKLGYHLGNTVKYISRCEKKGAKLDDLKKARWYLDREISNLGGK